MEVFPPKFEGLTVRDMVIGGLLDVAKHIGRLGRQFGHDVPDYVSDHYRGPGEALKAQKQAEYLTRMATIEQNYDGNGTPL